MQEATVNSRRTKRLSVLIFNLHTGRIGNLYHFQRVQGHPENSHQAVRSRERERFAPEPTV